MLEVMLVALALQVGGEPPGRPRIRELGVEPGILPPGAHNAITDVDGVLVGQVTLVEGTDVRTGVTAILPHGDNLFQHKVPAAVYVANAFGKAAGFLQIQELGSLETPIVLTNTLSVGTVLEAVVRWTLDQPGNQEVRSVNAVVGETNDGYLNDIRRQAVRPEHVVAAIEGARDGAVAEGSVGAGTGTRALGFKGGIGTSSRRLPDDLGGFTVGALVQSNFGGVLTIDGRPIGERLGRYSFRETLERVEGTSAAAEIDAGSGSCMIVVATDAPLRSSALERLAKRAPLALGRVGSYIGHGSGDFVIAFTTQRLPTLARDQRTVEQTVLSDRHLDPLFLATVEAVEEALYNSLLKATTVTGRDGHRVEAISIEALRPLLADRE